MSVCSLLLSGAPAHALTSVTILGDKAVSAALSQIARNYSRDRNVITNTAFTTEAAQEQEINEGGSADVLVTPRQAWIDKLKSQGVIDVYSQISVARNRLALVGPADSTVQATADFPTNQLLRAMNGEQLFVVGNPETLAEGIYGKEALRKLGAAEDLGEFTLYVKNLEEMYHMVSGYGAHGIFFYSSTIGREGVRIIDVLPETSHHPIEYYAVVVAGNNMDEARKFLEYLKGTEARRIFTENGFSVE